MHKWEKEDIEKAILLNKDGISYGNIAIILKRNLRSVKNKLNRLGYKTNFNTYYVIKKCEFCGIEFTSSKSENRKFCSQSCSATINNQKYPKRNKIIVKGKKRDKRKNR